MRPEVIAAINAACKAHQDAAHRAKLAELGRRTLRLASNIDFRNDVSLRAFALTFQGIALELGLVPGEEGKP